MRFTAATVFTLGLAFVGATLGGSQTVSPENFVHFGVGAEP